MKLLRTRDLPFWALLCASLTLITGTSCGGDEQNQYERAAQTIADKVVSLTEFGIDTLSPKSYGDYTWFLNLDWCSEKSNSATTKLVIEEGFSAEDGVMLGYAIGASAIELQIGNATMSLSSDAGLSIERTDYELITYPNYVDITSLILGLEGSEHEVVITFPDEAESRTAFMSVVDKGSRMINQSVKFISPVDEEGLVFRCGNGTYDAPSHLGLAGSLNYSDWRYYTGTFLTAMSDLSADQDETVYWDYIAKHIDFFNSNVKSVEEYRDGINQLTGPFTLYYRFNMLDDMGPQAAAVLEHLNRVHGEDVNAIQSDPLYRYVDRALDFIINDIPRLEDGTLVRITPEIYTVQSDDLFMSCLPLVRAAEVLNRPEYLDEAILQLNRFHEHLYNPETGLYFHSLFESTGEHGCCHWGRGMGWMMLIYSEVLQALPDSDPRKPAIVVRLGQVLNSIIKYQTDDGFWHQILTDTSSYAETSVTAMFTKTLADAVIHGWAASDSVKASAALGADALLTTIDANGDIQGIVRGTPIFPTSDDYVNHSARTNDPRGMGALIWAFLSASEM